MHKIYKLTCPEGKNYIGQTMEEISSRLRKHKVAAQLGFTFDICEAIRKFGIDSFKVEILEEYETQAEADERERFWIKELNTVRPNGYNIQSGGRFDKDRCVENAEVTAATVDRDSLPLYINFMKDTSRGYHSYVVRDKSGKLNMPEKAFRSGTKSLEETLRTAEAYLEQFVPREKWVYENKMGATRSNPKYEPTPGPPPEEENARLPQGIYYSLGKSKASDRPYYMVQDFKKIKRFPSKTFRAGKRSLEECKRLAEEYLETQIPKNEWKQRRKS